MLGVFTLRKAGLVVRFAALVEALVLFGLHHA